MKFRVGEKIKTITVKERDKLSYDDIEADSLIDDLCDSIGTISHISDVMNTVYKFTVDFECGSEAYPLTESEIKKLKTNIKFYKRILK